MKTSKQVLINPYFLVHILLPLIIGCGIYVLLRQSSMFFVDNWISYSLPKIKIVEFIKYNLPDGLWLYSLTSCMIVIWNNRINKENIMWVSFIPLAAFTSEFLQSAKMIEGTYDILDIISYSIALLLLIIRYKINSFTLNLNL